MRPHPLGGGSQREDKSQHRQREGGPDQRNSYHPRKLSTSLEAAPSMFWPRLQSLHSVCQTKIWILQETLCPFDLEQLRYRCELVAAAWNPSRTIQGFRDIPESPASAAQVGAREGRTPLTLRAFPKVMPPDSSSSNCKKHSAPPCPFSALISRSYSH